MIFNSGLSCWLISFLVVLGFLTSHDEAGGAGNQPTATTREGAASPLPDPLVMIQYTEAKEKAFSLLIPKGWKTEGGIFYVDPNTAGGAANSTAPKVNFSVKKDDPGTVMLQWLPDFYYIDMWFSPAAQMGLFPPGSRYNGMLVAPLPVGWGLSPANRLPASAAKSEKSAGNRGQAHATGCAAVCAGRPAAWISIRCSDGHRLLP